jgi:hypothetical protein
MPRIPTLDESQVLDVRAPVPIGSSESAREPGDLLASTGLDLDRVGSALGEYSAFKDRSLQEAQLENYRGQVVEATQKAHLAALGAVDDANNPLEGQALVDHFSKEVDDATQDLVNSQDDPTMKLRVQNIIRNTKNQQAVSLYSEAVKRGAEDIDNLNRQTVSQNIVANYSLAAGGADPQDVINQAVSQINGLKKSISNQAIFTPVIGQKYVNAKSAEMAYSAIDALQQSHNYAGAFAASKALGSYLDPDHVSKIEDSIKQSQTAYQEHSLILQNRADVVNDRNNRRAMDVNANNLAAGLATNSDPAQLQLYLDKAGQQLAQGLLDRQQYSQILTQYKNKTAAANNIFTGASAGAAAGTMSNHLVGQLLSGKDPTQLYSDVTQELSYGHVTPGTAQKLSDILTQRQSLQRSDPQMYNAVTLSDQTVRSTFDNNLPVDRPGQQMKINIGGARADVQASIVQLKDSLIKQGKDPNIATNIALQRFIPPPQAQPVIQGYPLNLQNDTKGLAQITEQVNAQAAKVPSGANPPLALINQQDALRIRMNAALIHEAKVQ